MNVWQLLLYAGIIALFMWVIQWFEKKKEDEKVVDAKFEEVKK